jgi:predicted flavoprotein YhiN
VNLAKEWATAGRCSEALGLRGGEPFADGAAVAAWVKRCPVPLLGPRPIAEAISSAGGVCFSEVDEDLMLSKWPGVFVAGEMLDWEAPTGGYLLQGCFATGTRAGAGVVRRAVGAQRSALV